MTGKPKTRKEIIEWLDKKIKYEYYYNYNQNEKIKQLFRSVLNCKDR